LENELDTATGGELGHEISGMQTMGFGFARVAAPLFRKEPPPSAKSSRRGGASCAPAQELVKDRNKIHGATIRIAPIGIL
jgi:hypothetical protein